MKLRVGTFNLYQFVKPPFACYTRKNKYNNRQWLEKTTWIKQQIINMECDIIGFQEVFSKEALRDLLRELGFTYFQTADDAKLSKTTPNKYISTTVAIASKYPIKTLSEVIIHAPSLKYHGDEDTFAFSRVPIKATIELPNTQHIVVYVTHLKSNRLNAFEKVFQKYHTLHEKKEHIKNVLNEKHSKALKQRLLESSSLFYDIKYSDETPSIILCDLNDKEYSPTIEALCNAQYHDENEEGLLLYDAYYEHNAHNIQQGEKAKRKATSYMRSKGNVLDYIFITKHFLKTHEATIAVVTDYHVFDTHLETYKNGSVIQSDHAQVVCELQMHKVIKTTNDL